ncbi:unnamed protein product [Symbiodinium necroappetens]|uniref:N-acetyltransferase domain-containing protein n=1 Tax=Symbiodinium necroappetens TaxID=1628268 RepID=A0A812PV06_9DINO|nr:unnamed protein product [Symbiodinium necroappetens]
MRRFPALARSRSHQRCFGSWDRVPGRVQVTDVSPRDGLQNEPEVFETSIKRFLEPWAMSDLPEELLSSWPPALLEEARQGVDSLPRWAQRELRDSHRTAEPDTSLQIGEVPVLEDRGSKDLPQLVPIVHEAAALAAQVRRLGEVEFQEDALELVDAEGPWTASALVQGAELLGFVVFGVLNGSMWLRYIAVVPRHRKKGYGRRLIEHVCQCCQEQGVLELTLFSKRELVPFYQAV